MAIRELKVTDPIAIDYILESAWFIVTLEKELEVTRLLDQKAVDDPFKKVLIVFCKIQFRPKLGRIFEVKNVMTPDDLEDLRDFLEGSGAQVSNGSRISSLS
jgi:tryptophan 2,3-dioxygenase